MGILIVVVVALLVVLLVLIVTGENQVNSYSDQLKLGQLCKFEVEFDNTVCKSLYSYIESILTRHISVASLGTLGTWSP